MTEFAKKYAGNNSNVAGGPTNPSRREFLNFVGAAATGVFAEALFQGGPEARAASAAGANLYEVLKSAAFQGAIMLDGRPLAPDALKKELAGKHVVVSFGFDHCSGYCPKINAVHAALGKKLGRDKVVSLVINMLPEEDRRTKETRQSYANMVKGAGVEQKIIPVFPDSGRNAIAIEQAFGEFVRMDDSKQHSAAMFLFDGTTGQYLAQQLGNTEPGPFLKKWEVVLSYPVTPAPQGAHR